MLLKNNVVSTNGTAVDNGQITFTDDQQKALDGLFDFIAKPFNPTAYAVGLIGAGGSGKTFLTKYLIKNCRYSVSVIKCASSTHKACRVFAQAIGNVIKVETIQSVFGLRLDLKLEDFNPDRPQFNPKGKIKLAEKRLLIVDEASMIPAGLVGYILKVCKGIECKVIFIGDDAQLAPVKEARSTAFNRCSKLFRLTQIVRQEDDNPLRDILNVLRDDVYHRTRNFINYVAKNVGKSFYNDANAGYCICNRTAFKELIDMSFHDEEFTKDTDMYRVISYTNACVNGWNTYIRNQIILDADKDIITRNDLIMSYETIVDDFMETVINNSEEYIINNIVNFVDKTYGFKGFLVKFQMVHGGAITKPLFVIDHRDRYTIQMYDKTVKNMISEAKNSKGGVRVSKWKAYYTFKHNYLLAANIVDRFGNLVYSRDIDYAFAITSHRAQGSTYRTVFIDVNDMIYDKNGNPYRNIDDVNRRLYVAVSRASQDCILCYQQ